MRSVRKGNGIKLPDETLETASFRTLLAVYSHLIYIEDIDNISNVIHEFQRHFSKEYEHLFGLIKYRISQYEIGSRIESRLKQYKTLLKEKLVKIVEVQREDIEDRIIEFHQDMMNDSIAAGAKINGDELIWQLKEFMKNVELIKNGNFR